MMPEEVMLAMENIQEPEEIGYAIGMLDALIVVLEKGQLQAEADILSHAMKKIWARSRHRIAANVIQTMEKSGVDVDSDEKDFIINVCLLTPEGTAEMKAKMKELLSISVEEDDVEKYHRPVRETDESFSQYTVRKSN